MGEWRFIVAAYVLTWATLAGYAIFLSRLRKRAESLHEQALRESQGGER